MVLIELCLLESHLLLNENTFNSAAFVFGGILGWYRRKIDRMNVVRMQHTGYSGFSCFLLLLSPWWGDVGWGFCFVGLFLFLCSVLFPFLIFVVLYLFNIKEIKRSKKLSDLNFWRQINCCTFSPDWNLSMVLIIERNDTCPTIGASSLPWSQSWN